VQTFAVWVLAWKSLATPRQVGSLASAILETLSTPGGDFAAGLRRPERKLPLTQRRNHASIVKCHSEQTEKAWARHFETAALGNALYGFVEALHTGSFQALTKRNLAYCLA